MNPKSKSGIRVYHGGVGQRQRCDQGFAFFRRQSRAAQKQCREQEVTEPQIHDATAAQLQTINWGRKHCTKVTTTEPHSAFIHASGFFHYLHRRDFICAELGKKHLSARVPQSKGDSKVAVVVGFHNTGGFVYQSLLICWIVLDHQCNSDTLSKQLTFNCFNPDKIELTSVITAAISNAPFFPGAADSNVSQSTVNEER